jgi:ABC-type multidrug transport system fused ATPase/permease subunit
MNRPTGDLMKLWRILSPQQRIAAGRVVALILVSIALEMLGLGLVVPSLAFILSPPRESEASLSFRWLDDYAVPVSDHLVLAGLAIILLVYAVKSAVLLLTHWRLQQFVASLNADMSRRLFSCYMEQPWAFHLQHNSTERIRTIQSISQMTDSIGWMLIAATELLMLSGVAAVLLWFEPVGAIAVSALVVLSTLLLDGYTRPRLVRLGAEQLKQSQELLRCLNDGLRGAKEWLMRIGCHDVADQFGQHASALSATIASKATLGIAPRLWYECVAVAGLCLLTAILFAQGAAASVMVPTLGLFAAAAFRVLPSVNRVASAMASMRFSSDLISIVAAELDDCATCSPYLNDAVPSRALPSPCPAAMSFSATIEMIDVSYRYPAASANALNGATFRVAKGSTTALVGPSGAGKSTVVDLLLGLLSPTSGRVMVDGVDISENIPGWQRHIGYVPQSVYLIDDTIRRNIAFGLRDNEIDDDAVRRSAQRAQLDTFIAGLHEGLETHVGENGVRLSGGQRQRIGIARALYHNPALLVLDEATSAIDSPVEQDVIKALRTGQAFQTLIIVTHRESTIANCDAVYRVEAGLVTPVELPRDVAVR